MNKIQPTLTDLRKIKKLIQGDSLPGSQFMKPIFDNLIRDHLIIFSTTGRRKAIAYAKDKELLALAIKQRWNIMDIDKRMDFLQKKSRSRIDNQNETDDTKAKKSKSYRGFLVSAITPLNYKYKGEEGMLELKEGTFLHIYDFQDFDIDKDVIVVYVENFTCFRYIKKYMHLIGKNDKYLFISRFGSTMDFTEWLSTIPNQYLHFGDFDLAGIDIYLKVYNKIGTRAQMVIPDDIKDRISKKGNADLFHNTIDKYKNLKISDRRVQPLVDLILKYHKCYEQEGYAILENSQPKTIVPTNL